MVRRVARRVHRLDRPAGACDGFAVSQPVIGHEIEIGALLDLFAVATAAMGSERIRRRARRGLDRHRCRRMVEVGVGDQDVAHGFAPHRVEERLDMRGQIGARIDDRHRAGPDDVGAGAVERKGTGIGGDNPADQR